MSAALTAIPTIYAGTRFRSRLEARWAAFFDLCKWRWEYEPPEEDGWIPDFLLIGASRIVKVEVEPIAWVGNEVVQQVADAPGLQKVRAYMEKQYQEWRAKTEEPFLIDEDFGDVLVLGAYPHFLDGGYLSPMLGVFLSPVDPPDIALLAKGYPPRELDFYADQGCFRYRMGGEPLDNMAGAVRHSMRRR